MILLKFKIMNLDISPMFKLYKGLCDSISSVITWWIKSQQVFKVFILTQLNGYVHSFQSAPF